MVKPKKRAKKGKALPSPPRQDVEVEDRPGRCGQSRTTGSGGGIGAEAGGDYRISSTRR